MFTDEEVAAEIAAVAAYRTEWFTGAIVFRLAVEKQCPRCGQTKDSLKDFGVYTRDDDGKVYVQSWCKPCSQSRPSRYRRRPPRTACKRGHAWATPPGRNGCGECRRVRLIEGRPGSGAGGLGMASAPPRGRRARASQSRNLGTS